jgi:hypothetical protein
VAENWRIVLDALGARLDTDLLPAIYDAASVPTPLIREELIAANLAFRDPTAGLEPDAAALADAVSRLSRQASRRSLAVGAASGLVGAAAIPPEVLATLVQTLRMGQRLAVIYGFDPDTDAGRIVLWRALAAAWDVDFPDQGRLSLKVSELPALLRAQAPATQSAAGWLARQVTGRALLSVASRVTRLVPGLGAGLAALGAQRRTAVMASRMAEVFSRAVESETWALAGEEIAVEIP